MFTQDISGYHAEDFYSSSKEWPQIVVLLSASFTSLAAGSLYALSSSPTSKLLTGKYDFTIEEVSYIPVIPIFAMIITAPLFCMLVDKAGRKYTLILTGVLQLMSWILITFAENIYAFYISRAVYGISNASFYAAMPAYIAEVTTPKVRNFGGNIIVIASYVGYFLSNCMAYCFSIQTSAFIMSALPIIFITSFVFMPDSPYYSTMMKDYDAAHKSLKILRHSEDVQNELNQLNIHVQRQMSESRNFKDLFLIESNRKSLLIANLCQIFQQTSGFWSIIVYSQSLIAQADGRISEEVSAIISSGMLVIAMFSASIFTYILGRKGSMVTSCLGCGITQLLLAIYFYLESNDIVDVSIISLFPLVGLVAYAMTFATGLAVIPTVILGEIFSTNIRKHASTVTIMVLGICSYAMNKLFQTLMAYGLWIPFCSFGVCCFISSMLSHLFIPETKGKTLEGIQQMLKRNVKLRNNETVFVYKL